MTLEEKIEEVVYCSVRLEDAGELVIDYKPIKEFILQAIVKYQMQIDSFAKLTDEWEK